MFFKDQSRLWGLAVGCSIPVRAVAPATADSRQSADFGHCSKVLQYPIDLQPNRPMK